MRGRNPVTTTQAQDPIYIQDDIEYGPPRPPSEPRSQTTVVKTEGVDSLPMKPLQNGHDDSHAVNGRPRQSSVSSINGKHAKKLTSLRSDAYVTAVEMNLPSKPMEFQHKRKGRRSQRSRKRRADVISYEQDFATQNRSGGNSKTASLTKMHTAQISFDGGAGIRAISFNSTGAQLAVTCE